MTIEQLQAAKFTWPKGLVVKGAMRPMRLAAVSGLVCAVVLHLQAIKIAMVDRRWSFACSQLIVLNELGQEVGNIDFDRGTADGNDFYVCCQVDGGLILIETAAELLAVDLYRDSRLADALLWRHSLQTPSASPNVQERKPRPRVSSRCSDLDIKERVHFCALVGPITPAGVPVQSGSTLTMLDCLTGSTIWTLDNLSDQTRFATSGVELAVVEPSRGTVLILDCRDGTELRKVE